MTTPIWVPHTAVLATQEALLQRFGGGSGIRDQGLLESALSRPANLFLYEQPSIFDLASSYAFGLIKNHPFVDGNKRIGFVTAYIFLGMNGHYFHAPEEEAVERTLALAASAITEADYAIWLKKSCA